MQFLLKARQLHRCLPVVVDQVDVVPEQRGYADREKDCHKKDKDDVILGGPDRQAVRPEADEVLD